MTEQPSLKERLHSDLNAAMKARDELTTATLRMALTAVTTEEVAGSAARQLSNDEVLRVLGREAKKRREAAEAFDGAGRTELAERERAEGTVLDRYLPAQLGDDELGELVAAAIAEAGATTPGDMGAVMKLVQPRVAGRADGKRVSDEVRRRLA
ncbi:MAG: GatB/YqeY domain-containing protein [Jatrophihabitans sp.]|uniref:GatB/YqeY domain-containing protein n=1 Tax=Jatrophihabitans sp. TaxID=1932789 RepID=UPI00390D349F